MRKKVMMNMINEFKKPVCLKNEFIYIRKNLKHTRVKGYITAIRNYSGRQFRKYFWMNRTTYKNLEQYWQSFNMDSRDWNIYFKCPNTITRNLVAACNSWFNKLISNSCQIYAIFVLYIGNNAWLLLVGSCLIALTLVNCCMILWKELWLLVE